MQKGTTAKLRISAIEALWLRATGTAASTRYLQRQHDRDPDMGRW